MQLIIKTLKGSHFEIRAQPNDTVMAVKKNIEDVQGKDNYPCGQQLLLYNGMMLKDETTLAENKVSGDGFLVLMLTKSKRLGSAGASSTQPASTNPPATAPTSNPTAPAAPAAPAEAPAAPAEAPAQAPVSTGLQPIIPLLPLDKAEEHEEKEKAKPVTYSYSFFHLIFSLASMYSATLLTGWSTSVGESGKLVDVGWPSVWVRIITGWATAALYVWSLIAPILFPEREF